MASAKKWVTTNEVTVYANVGGSASLSPDCDDTFTYSATGTGGSGRIEPSHWHGPGCTPATARRIARGFRNRENYRLRMLLIGGGLAL